LERKGKDFGGGNPDKKDEKKKKKANWGKEKALNLVDKTENLAHYREN